MKQHHILAVTCAILFCASPVVAQKYKVQPTVTELGRVTLVPADLNVASNRMSIISALQGYCKALQRNYPTNSPAEDAWIERELLGDGDRAVRAMDSAEAGRRIANNFTSSCLELTKAYQSSNRQHPLILFALIGEIARFAPDAAMYANKNGLKSDEWGFYVLNGTIRTLSQMGVAETQDMPKR